MHLKGSGLANLDKDPSIITQPFPQSILDKYVHKYILELYPCFYEFTNDCFLKVILNRSHQFRLPQIHTRMTKPRLFVN